MNVVMKLLRLAVVGGLSACAHTERAANDGLTPTGLIAIAEQHRGQTATVVGYFTWRTDTRALWESRDAHLDALRERKGADYDYWAKCLTIYPLGDARRLTDRRVRVTGKVVIVADNEIRSLWTCNRVALQDAVITPE